MDIFNNESLSSCCGLVRFIDGTVDISWRINILLRNAVGCSSDTEVTNTCSEALTIDADSDVPSNVKALTRITGDLTIGGTITSFPDFAALRVVEGNLTIDAITTPALTSLDEIFPLLENVQGNLIIQNNDIIQAISGFLSLRSVEGAIGFTSNAALRVLPVFRTLASITGDATITGNAALASCCGLLRLADGLLKPGGTTTISGNATGCNDNTEIINHCVRTTDIAISVDGDVPTDASTITRIEGNLTIGGTITNFPNFASLEFVKGNLIIRGITTSTLISLDDIFPFLDSIHGDLIIEENDLLQTLSGFVALDSIGGNLEIEENDVLTELPPFDVLARTAGDITLQNNAALTTFPAFPVLTDIGGALSIANHTSLTTISSFSLLATTGGDVTIQDNAALMTFPAFPVLTEVGGALSVNNHTVLTTISSFSLLATTAGDVTLQNNAALTTFPAFSALKDIGGAFSIANHAALTAFSSFDLLKGIGGNFFIDNNAALTTISGFDSLTSIGGDVMIQNNVLLETIAGFDMLETLTGAVTVTNNTVLSSCCGLLRIADDIVMPGGATDISSNAEGCNNIGEIRNICPRIINDDSDVPADVDSFTRIITDLTIGGTITKFPNFDALEVVEGNIIIRDLTETTLTSLTDIFPVLDSIRGDLIIEGNDFIQTISGFTSLDSIGGDISIGSVGSFGVPSVGNNALTTLPSFPALTKIGGALEFFFNPKLTTLPSFSALTRVGGNIGVAQNEALGTISGFEALESIEASFLINQNAALGTISGFDVLESIGSTQLTFEGNIRIIENAALTALPTFDALTRIKSGLFIENNASLTTFPSFSKLTSVGRIVIQLNTKLETIMGFEELGNADDVEILGNRELATLSGFDMLQTITGDLEIANTKLTALPSFSALQSIRRGLRIDNNGALTTLSGFDVLQSIGEDLRIDNNAVLATVSGFDILQTITGNLEIGTATPMLSGNPLLTTLPSFSALTSIGGTLRFALNPKLTALSPFAALNTLGGSLDIVSNEMLATVSGFGALTRIEEHLSISDNAALTTISGFNVLASIQGNLSITGNAALSSCCGLIIAGEVLTPEGTTDISSNTTGCSNIGEIKANCGFVRTLLATPQALTASAEAGKIILNVFANVPWALTESADWITSLSPASGSDNQAITITYNSNLLITEREATLTLSATDAGGTESVSILFTQSGAARELSAFPIILTATEEAGTVRFGLSANIPWRIVKNPGADWITSISPDNGSDNQTITITYEANSLSTERVGLISISNTDAGANAFARVTFTQKEVGARVLSVNLVLPSVPAEAGMATLDVVATIPWALTESVDWITALSPASGSNSQTITITYETNPLPTQREAMLTLSATGAGATESVPITFTQSGIVRELSASSLTLTIPAKAGMATLDVVANIPWALTENADWITSISPASGNNNQTITITYEENISIIQKKATLTLAATDAGATESVPITITQEEGARVLSVDNTALDAPARVGTVNLNVVANIPWALTENADWITSFSPESGNDNQMIAIMHNANDLTTTREAIFTLSAADGGAESIEITLTQARTTASDALGVPAGEKTLRFFPNPATNNLYIEGVSEATTLIIRTFSGATLLRATVRQNQFIDLDVLPQGVYLLTLQSAQEQITRRLVIGF